MVTFWTYAGESGTTLSYRLSLRSLFCLFLSGCFTQIYCIAQCIIEITFRMWNVKTTRAQAILDTFDFLQVCLANSKVPLNSTAENN